MYSKRFLVLVFLFGAAADQLLGNNFPKKQEIDAIVKPLIEAEELVGAVVGITTPEGKHILTYGSTEYGENNPPNGNTVYEIGSVTKTFTGVLLADLVNRDLIALDDAVSTFLPESVEVPNVAGQEMTLWHLATHTAGFTRDPTNLRPRDPLNRFADYTVPQLYAALKVNIEPSSAPVQDAKEEEKLPYQYSSVGIGLLGHIMERQEGKSFEELVVEMICAPLDMNDTRISLNDDQAQRLATGYYFYDQQAPSFSGGSIPGCVALRSTGNDMLKFLDAHLHDDDSSIASAAHLASTSQHEASEHLSVGLCWHIDRKSGIVWHGGTTTGFTSAVSFHRDSGVGVVVLTNSKSILVTPLAGAILGVSLGNSPKPIPVRRRTQIDQELLESYAGTYQDKSKPFLAALQSTRTVAREGDHLRIKGFKGEEFPVYPESETDFFCKGENIYATFKREDDGKVSGLMLNLWGYKSKLTRAN